MGKHAAPPARGANLLALDQGFTKKSPGKPRPSLGGMLRLKPAAPNDFSAAADSEARIGQIAIADRDTGMCHQ
jgi:hypothetical protein